MAAILGIFGIGIVLTLGVLALICGIVFFVSFGATFLDRIVELGMPHWLHSSNWFAWIVLLIALTVAVGGIRLIVGLFFVVSALFLVLINPIIGAAVSVMLSIMVIVGSGLVASMLFPHWMTDWGMDGYLTSGTIFSHVVLFFVGISVPFKTNNNNNN